MEAVFCTIIGWNGWCIIPFITVTIGCLTAPKVGLTSLIHEKNACGRFALPRLKRQYKFALLIGLAFALAVVLLDMAFLPFMGEEFQADRAKQGYLAESLKNA